MSSNTDPSKLLSHKDKRKANQALKGNQQNNPKPQKATNPPAANVDAIFANSAASIDKMNKNNSKQKNLQALPATPAPSVGDSGFGTASDMGVSPAEGLAAIQAPAPNQAQAELAGRIARAKAEGMPKVLNAEEARKIQSKAAKKAQESQAMIDNLIGPNSYNARVQRAVAANALTEQRAAERKERNENKKRMEGLSAQDAEMVRDLKKASKAQSKARKDGVAGEKKLVEGMVALVKAAVKGGN